MTSELALRVEAVLARPPLSDADAEQLRELGRAVRSADGFEDLPGKWQAAILQAEGGAGESPGCHSCH